MESTTTNINLDDLSKDNRDRLQQRAAIHGRSLESELDSILTSVFEFLGRQAG